MMAVKLVLDTGEKFLMIENQHVCGIYILVSVRRSSAEPDKNPKHLNPLLTHIFL